MFAKKENTTIYSITPSIHAIFYRYINYSCPNPDDDHISLAVRRRQPDQTLDAGHRSCIRHSAAAAGVVLTRRAVRLEVLVVVLLAVVEARRRVARHDRAAVVCQVNHCQTQDHHGSRL